MGTPVHEDSLLTVSQVAQRLTVSAKTVRRLVERGELPALRIGSSVRVDPDELRTWLYDVATARDGRTARVDGDVPGGRERDQNGRGPECPGRS